MKRLYLRHEDKAFFVVFSHSIVTVPKNIFQYVYIDSCSYTVLFTNAL